MKGDNKMNFGEKLTNLRKQKGLSQEELGEKLDVTRQTISKWELGQTSPDAGKLTEIAKFFEVGVNELTNEEEDIINKEDTKQEGKKSSVGAIVFIIILILVLLGAGFYIARLVFVNSIFNIFDRTTEQAEKMVSTFGNIVIEAEKNWKEEENEFRNTWNTAQSEVITEFEKEHKEDSKKFKEEYESIKQEIDSSSENMKQMQKEMLNNTQQMQQELMKGGTQEQQELLQKAQQQQQEMLNQMQF